jgi:hypothetical protein
LLGKGFLACLLSNTLYAAATVWYAYITHLGYRGKSTGCFDVIAFAIVSSTVSCGQCF